MTPYEQQMQAGQAAFRDWHEEKAQSCFRQAIELAATPDEAAEAYYYLSMLIEKPEQALEYIQIILQINPKHCGALYQLAGREYQTASLSTLHSLGRLDPLDYQEWNYALSCIYTLLGKPHKARKCMRKGQILWYKRISAKHAADSDVS